MSVPTRSPDAPAAPPAAVGRARRVVGAALGLALFAYTALLCAEFVSNSAPAPLLIGYKLLAYVPYYVLLLALIGRYGRLSVRSLYLFGAVLGLASESFVTKVAWAHPDGSNPVLPPVAGFGPWELVTLVFAYHPVLSVLVPVLLAGAAFGLPYPVALGTGARRALLAVLPVLTGVFASFGHRDPRVFAAALVVNAITLSALIAAYRRWGAPVRRVPRWLTIAALVVVVAVTGFALPVRFVPAPATVLVTCAALAVLVTALARSVRRDRDKPAPVVDARPAFSPRWYAAYLVGFAVVALGCFGLLRLAAGAGATVVALLALAAGAVGTGYLVLAVIRALLPHRQPTG